VPASIVVPTRARPSYLQVALASISPQAAAEGAEVLVIDDAGPTADGRALAERFRARYQPHPRPLGLNAARNTGVQLSSGELVVFVDDDVRADPGWLQALLKAARENPDTDVFTGPIRPCFENGRPRSCGREEPPITSLDLGPADTDAGFAWGANMAIRRSALQRVGPFDASIEHGGDEQEWQERLKDEGSAPVRYVARAAVEHRRAGSDARLGSLARAAFIRGRAARRFDARREQAPPLWRELRTLGACAAHVVRRRCPAGLTLVAHSTGRLLEGLTRAASERTGATDPATGALQPPSRAEVERDDFLSGESGTVGGADALARGLLDAGANALAIASGRRLALALAARKQPPRRRVLVLGVERPALRRQAQRARTELLRSRHDVVVQLDGACSGGKFENLNRLLAEHPADGYDWLLVIDDDVELPHGFLDRFLFLCERFELQLAQPAHRLRSHAAWAQTRRQLRSVVRETAFVEIGPVTAFARETFAVLLPFPQLRMGWGLDLHWAALARAHGWRCGVIDAVSIRHRLAPAASAYSRAHAIAEARAFLAERPYLPAAEAKRTLMAHRRW
jgi:GT2 family glycosyltransferase